MNGIMAVILLALCLVSFPIGSCAHMSYAEIISAGIEASATCMATAAEHFRTAIHVQPEQFDGHLNLGSALLQMAASAESTVQQVELLEHARAAIDTAIRVRPDDANAAKVRGKVVAALEEAVASQRLRNIVKPLVSGRKVVVMDNAVPEEERERVIGAYIAGKAGNDASKWMRHYATGHSVFANAHGLNFNYRECLRKPMHEIIAELKH